MFVVPAQAVHDLGLFELDRNAQDTDFANLPDDWAALYDGGANTGAHSDDSSGVLPDIGADGGTQFQGGGSKDGLDITSWLWKKGEPLDKDDITNAYAAAYTNTVDTGNRRRAGMSARLSWTRSSRQRYLEGAGLSPAPLFRLQGALFLGGESPAPSYDSSDAGSPLPDELRRRRRRQRGAGVPAPRAGRR
jgi:hypothetical protein